MSADSAPVTIFDEVVLPAGSVDAWLDRWRAEYVPGALRRGLVLRGVWRGHTEDAEQSVVVIQWSLATIEAFFASRGQAGADPSVTSFWEATDQLAISRNRRVLEDAGVAL
ncbi:MAG TPA: hypothetical protein VHZ96_14875 [Frankiaceae bacterium]|nr:hypothetical protein [Frankiaceae bacterium]